MVGVYIRCCVPPMMEVGLAWVGSVGVPRDSGGRDEVVIRTSAMLFGVGGYSVLIGGGVAAILRPAAAWSRLDRRTEWWGLRSCWKSARLSSSVRVCWLSVGHVANSCVCYSVRVWICTVFFRTPVPVCWLSVGHVVNSCICYSVRVWLCTPPPPSGYRRCRVLH